MRRAMIVKVPTKREGVVVVERTEPTKGLVYGQTTESALRKAKKAGVREPMLFFVPDPNKRYVY